MLLLGLLAFSQQQVHLDEIISLANNYVLPTRQTNDAIDTIYCKVDPSGDTVLYQILYKNKSFVLLSGSKACQPILAYGEAGSQFPIWDDMHDTNGGTKALVGEYEAQVRHCFANDTITLSFQSEWSGLMSNTRNSAYIVVPNLLTSQWGQQFSNDSTDTNAYNYYIAPLANGCIPPTGCVAVAMAQIMNYWKYPVYDRRNSRQFDWCNMADKLVKSSVNYENERDAIAWLMEECGRMTNMNYTCSGSGTSCSNAYNAFKNLNYDNNTIEAHLYVQYAQYSGDWESWVDKIKENINEKIPIFYGINSYTAGGHAVVLDGYDSENKFHINWGLKDSYDGYYSLDPLLLGVIDFSIGHEAIFGIKPPSSDYDFCDFDLDLADHYHQYYTELELNELEPWENVPQTAQNLTSPSFCDNSAEDWRVIPTGEQSSYLAHKSVELLPGFHAERGSEFVAKIVPCPNCDNRNLDLSDGRDVADNDAGYDDSAVDEKGSMFEDKGMEPVIKDGEKLFPNPSKDRITYKGNDVYRVFVYDMAGKPVFRWFIVSKTDDEVTIDIKNIEAGTYLLYVVNNDSSRSAYKFVKK